MKQIQAILFLAIFSGICCIGLQAQVGDTIQKEVEVEKPYEPTVPEVSKINELPRVHDTSRIVPEFEYRITPRSITHEFKTEPIQAARMVGEPLSKLYPRYVALGFGSQVSPLVELGANTGRSDDHEAGMYFKHLSHHSKIKLTDDFNAPARSADNNLLLYGKKFTGDAFLSGNMNLASYGRTYYGHEPSLITDSVKESDPERQRFFNLGFNTRYKSSHEDSSKINYDVQFDYYYFKDLENNYENGLQLAGTIDKAFDGELFGLDTDVEFYDKSISIDSSDHFLFGISPWIGKYGKSWLIKLGLEVIGDNNGKETKMYYYPKASFEYNIVNNIVVPYAGVDGGLQYNNYKDIAMKNPYILPGLKTERTDKKFELFGGIKGHISSKSSFNAGISYSFIDNMAFFKLSNNAPTLNQFGIAYHDVEFRNIHGELNLSFGEKIDILIKGNHYKYTLLGLDEDDKEGMPWHIPDYALGFSGRYNLGNKILLNADLQVEGERPVSSNVQGVDKEYLDGIFNANLGLEYLYSKTITARLNFYNLTNNRYSVWNNYPTRGFSVLAGLSYAF
jgi:hypothetical protein